MRLEHYSSDQLQKSILKITRKYLGHEYKVFFFGSRVKGTNFPRADIDIGIEGPRLLPPAVKLSIEEELEQLPTLYKIDLVDFKTVTDQFKKVATKNIELIS